MEDDRKAHPIDVDVGITLVAKQGKTQHVLENLSKSTTVMEVKQMLSDITRILPKRQKLIGLASTSGKIADDMPLSMLKAKTTKIPGVHRIGLSFILMGTPEENILIDPIDRDDLPEVIDDFDLDFNAGSTEVSSLSFLHFSLQIACRPYPVKPCMLRL